MNIILFGGAGYIGTFIAEHFLNNPDIKKIYIFDIRETSLKHEKIVYRNVDVREKISPEWVEKSSESWIFNLAAIHREPGHKRHEYFDTNIKGAENVCQFAEEINCKNIYFTSSIATYGRVRELKNEKSDLYPETPYGISKLLAEKIHEKWLAKENDRRLIICRPAVIYGPRDPGNIYRMIKGIKKGYFFFPGDPNIIKSFGYIYGMLDSIDFTMSKKDRLIIYNYAEHPNITLKQLSDIVKDVLNSNTRIFRLPLSLLVIAATFITVVKKNSSIHPVRVRKAAFPTNIQPLYLIENNFNFKYPGKASFMHWKEVNPSDFN